MYDYFHVRILLFLKRHQVFVPNLQYVLKCCLNRWKQRWKSIFCFKGMKISHKQLTWVFLFLKYFLLQFHLGVETVWAVQKLLYHQIEPWSLWVLMSKHRKWSACLFMTYKLTCCFCLEKAFRCLLTVADCRLLPIPPHPLCLRWKKTELACPHQFKDNTSDYRQTAILVDWLIVALRHVRAVTDWFLTINSSFAPQFIFRGMTFKTIFVNRRPLKWEGSVPCL